VPEENQSAALDQLLEGFPTPSLISGRVEETPDGAWIRYEFKPSDDVDYVRALSQGDIASGVLAAMSRARGWPEIRGKSFTRHLPDGSRRLESESAVGGLDADVREASEHEVVEELRAAAQAARVTLETVRFAHLNGRLAPEITVVTADPVGYAEDASRRTWTITEPIVDRKLVEGTFVVVSSEQGEWVHAAGYSVRLHGGVCVTHEEDTVPEQTLH